MDPVSAPQTARETPDDYPFADWRQSAIAYRGALDDMGQHMNDVQVQLASAQHATDPLQAQLQDAEAKIATAITALGGKAA